MLENALDHIAMPAVTVAKELDVLGGVPAHMHEARFFSNIQDLPGFFFGHFPSSQLLDGELPGLAEPHAHFCWQAVNILPFQLRGVPAITAPDADGIILVDIGHHLIISVDGVFHPDCSVHGDDPVKGKVGF